MIPSSPSVSRSLSFEYNPLSDETLIDHSKRYIVETLQKKFPLRTIRQEDINSLPSKLSVGSCKLKYSYDNREFCVNVDTNGNFFSHIKVYPDKTVQENLFRDLKLFLNETLVDFEFLSVIDLKTNTRLEEMEIFNLPFNFSHNPNLVDAWKLTFFANNKGFTVIVDKRGHFIRYLEGPGIEAPQILKLMENCCPEELKQRTKSFVFQELSKSLLVPVDISQINLIDYLPGSFGPNHEYGFRMKYEYRNIFFCVFANDYMITQPFKTTILSKIVKNSLLALSCSSPNTLFIYESAGKELDMGLFKEKKYVYEIKYYTQPYSNTSTCQIDIDGNIFFNSPESKKRKELCPTQNQNV